ncbi:phosphoribosylaminoimidazole-succinocarboxamide synthase [Caldanaerobius fijiensis DSM 17918]|uniref:Phosphoribosylaminoimidazole-succinocarboxamide synthase n=1 Tax=Caldanaerobius fijiensis DSM 17918 TaxID=1121256 RepID=A0A1M5A6Y0_9THEO|nr:phosphoribosylaminoimidazolesuccinocarboxamide synthase [Caldanaerobius fijiensis]SHF25796.1 phosphoribosylaminoimidazole-succinocarboxamide synthase [Caldanaerobius fijiensis DSM 17918]
MEKLEMLYEGKAKKVYRTSDPDLYVVEYKDDATAFNGLKKGTIIDKGIVNNKMSAFFFKMLEDRGVPTHFEKLLSDREMLVKAVKIVPVEVLIRNYAAGSLSKRLGIKEGTRLNCTVLEFCYKNDELGDPFINEDHIKAMGLATEEEVKVIKEYSLKVNEILTEYLLKKEIILADFKLEFGRYGDKIVLADEISPDTCRFWDAKTMEKLDKDRFRRDMGGVEEAYQEVLRRVIGE